MSTSILSDANHSSYNINLEHFTIIKVIGRGSFGKVYLVRKNDDNQFFAMKTLKKDQIIRKNQKQNTKGIFLSNYLFYF
jgi:serine/threonine protein kinase